MHSLKLSARILMLGAVFAAPLSAANVTITAEADMTFSPPTVTINVGDTVTFKNGGGFHDVSADDGSFRCAQGCDGEGGNGSPSSASWSFSRVFNQAGTIGYHCEQHGAPGLGMHGTIVVNTTAPPPPPPAPGRIGFTNSTYSVTEGTAKVTIAVARTGGSDGAVSVSYGTGGGTATPGADYAATSGTLSWADGEAALKTFQVPIVDDTLPESTETVGLSLSAPTGGASLATSSATLNIFDNDSSGVTAPAAPTGLTATATDTTSVTLQWQDHANNETSFEVQGRKLTETAFATLGTAAANATSTVVESLDQGTAYLFKVRARNAGASSAFTPEVLATTDTVPGTCTVGANTLCLGTTGRFEAAVSWRTATDTGAGSTVPLPTNPDSGLFYFFAPSNIEMLIKTLNACAPPFNSYWVFFAATTNVEFTVQVTDTLTGKRRTYFNPLGQAATPVQDTSAFATCQ